MMHGDMRTYSNGRKKKYNAWSTKKREHTFVEMSSSSSAPPRPGSMQSATIKSVVTSGVMPTKIESPKYTGTLVKGISTMHKSNAVPILSESEAKEHASMRR